MPIPLMSKRIDARKMNGQNGNATRTVLNFLGVRMVRLRLKVVFFQINVAFLTLQPIALNAQDHIPAAQKLELPFGKI